MRSYLCLLFDGCMIIELPQSKKMWNLHTQQHTAARAVSIDSTFKIGKKVSGRSHRCLWSLVDVDTGVICSQQMLTNETNEDLMPMIEKYVERCQILDKPLPSRVSTDRGLQDTALLKGTEAFPLAHINVDNWHFNQLFLLQTLNRQSILLRACHQEFKIALYSTITLPDGTASRTHAEPEDICDRVDAVIKKYGKSESGPPPITSATKTWWATQKTAITEKRVLSNPLNGDTGRVSSSRHEAYHHHLNRITRGLIKSSPQHIHHIISQFRFRWNVQRRIAAQLEKDWKTFDLSLVQSAFLSLGQLMGTDHATSLFDKSPIIEDIGVAENFGLIHRNVTFDYHMSLASQDIPYTEALLEQIQQRHLAGNRIIASTASTEPTASAAATPEHESSTLTASSLHIINTLTTVAKKTAVRISGLKWLADNTGMAPDTAHTVNAHERAHIQRRAPC